MMVFWKIRYLDRTAKQFKDRRLYLDTDTLDPVVRAAVELTVAGRSSATEREILKYRHLFCEGDLDFAADVMRTWRAFHTVYLREYFEDETGREMPLREMGPILTGSPTAVFVPNGAKPHDIDLMFAEAKPVPVASVSLTLEEVRIVGYFVRDLCELCDSAFMKDGPGSIRTVGNISSPTSGEPVLETAVSDDEIRSFVMIFRRLYMTGKHDPASFLKTVAIFAHAVGDHPYAAWVTGVAEEYKSHLVSTPESRPFVHLGACTFTTQRLIDVFLYTQYAHQPDEKRQRQFLECLSHVHGKRGLLTWMFLCEIWKCSLLIGNAGRLIAAWFGRYCEHHGLSPDVLNSLRHDHSGIGRAEKEDNRKARLFREKAEELAMELWKQHGRPEGGPAQFLLVAREQLNRAIT